MPREYCNVCDREYPQGDPHTCYEIVDRAYLMTDILQQSYIQCGVCGEKAYLSAIEADLIEGWVRRPKSVIHKGYLCNKCFKHFTCSKD